MGWLIKLDGTNRKQKKNKVTRLDLNQMETLIGNSTDYNGSGMSSG